MRIANVVRAAAAARLVPAGQFTPLRIVAATKAGAETSVPVNPTILRYHALPRLVEKLTVLGTNVSRVARDVCVCV